MNLLVKTYIDLCFLKAGPQVLPASGFLVGLTLVAYGLSGLMLIKLDMPWPTALGQVTLDILILLAFIQVALRYAKKDERFLQTSAAALGTGTILNLIALPLTYWILLVDEPTSVPFFSWILLMLLMLWSLAILGNILRHALATSQTVGVLTALGYIVVSYMIQSWVFFDGAA